MGLLQHIQSRTKQTKRMYTFVISAVLTGGIATVWMSTLPARFVAIKLDGIEESVPDPSGLPELFGEIKTQVGSVISATDKKNIENDEIPFQDNQDSALVRLQNESLDETVTEQTVKIEEIMIRTIPNEKELIPIIEDNNDVSSDRQGVVSVSQDSNEEKKVHIPQVILIATSTIQNFQ